MNNTTFDQAVEIINFYYLQNGYSKNSIYAFKLAVDKIKTCPNHSSCSFVVSKDWLKQKQNEKSHSEFKKIRNAVYLIRSVIEKGTVTSTRFVYESSPKYQRLNEEFKLSLDNFLIDHIKKDKYTFPYIESIRQACSRRIVSLMENGITSPSLINHKSLKFFSTDPQLNWHATIKARNRYNTTFSHYIKYVEKLFNKPKTLHLMLNMFFVDRIIYIKDLEEVDKNKFDKFLIKTKNEKSFEQLKTKFISLIEKSNYSLVEKQNAFFFINQFHLFLDVNELFFSMDLTSLWVSFYIKNVNYSKENMFTKNLFRFQQLYDTGKIDFTLINRTFESKYKPPSWSKDLLKTYIKERKDSDCSKSTLCMDNSSVGRFLEYLEIIGVTSCSQITPGVVVDFQIQDKHKTPEGKNAYSTRIRSFIKFLARNSLVPDTLELSVSAANADSLKIVKVLNKKQKNSIYDFVENCSSPMDYRVSAMALLALNLGLRNCDIINLKFSDINWRKQSIHFVQQKTNVPITLPMPNIVANTLYRYITEGRPVKASSLEYVFVHHRMPYTRLNSNALRRQTNDILKKYNCNKIDGSHTLRKDFATSQLRKQNKFQTIIAALGQTTSKSIKPYLALDEINIKKCSINLNGIELKEGLYE